MRLKIKLLSKVKLLNLHIVSQIHYLISPIKISLTILYSCNLSNILFITMTQNENPNAAPSITYPIECTPKYILLKHVINTMHKNNKIIINFHFLSFIDD